MAKVVDRDERRSAMAEAILDIAARDGMGSVTVGNVAAESGVSKGAVQHYFPSKFDMLDTAARRLHERVGARVAAADANVQSVLSSLLPRTAADRRDSAAGHALFAVALSDPELRCLYVRGRASIRSTVEELVRGLTDDTGATARQLLGLVADLGDSILLDELNYEESCKIIAGCTSALSRPSGPKNSHSIR